MKKRKVNEVRDKKGLSDIVVTLIIIVLSLVAIGVVWVVVSNMLKSGTQQASFQFGTLFLDLKIDKVLVDSNGNYLVTISRGTGQGDLTGIDFVFSDGKNSQVVKESTSIQELGSQTFTFSPSDLGSISVPTEIDIAPVLNSGGSDQVGSKVDSKFYSVASCSGAMYVSASAYRPANPTTNTIWQVPCNSACSAISGSFIGLVTNYVEQADVSGTASNCGGVNFYPTNTGGETVNGKVVAQCVCSVSSSA